METNDSLTCMFCQGTYYYHDLKQILGESVDVDALFAKKVSSYHSTITQNNHIVHNFKEMIGIMQQREKMKIETEKMKTWIDLQQIKQDANDAANELHDMVYVSNPKSKKRKEPSSSDRNVACLLRDLAIETSKIEGYNDQLIQEYVGLIQEMEMEDLLGQPGKTLSCLEREKEFLETLQALLESETEEGIIHHCSYVDHFIDPHKLFYCPPNVLQMCQDLGKNKTKKEVVPRFKENELVACPKCGAMDRTKKEWVSDKPDNMCLCCGARPTYDLLSRLMCVDGHFDGSRANAKRMQTRIWQNIFVEDSRNEREAAAALMSLQGNPEPKSALRQAMERFHDARRLYDASRNEFQRKKSQNDQETNDANKRIMSIQESEYLLQTGGHLEFSKYGKFDVIQCAAKDCVGQVCLADSNKKCTVCQQLHCPECWKFCDPKTHQCKDADIESVTTMVNNYGQCPKCRVPVERSEGCFMMFCTVCRTGFDYKDSKILETRGSLWHNPHTIYPDELKFKDQIFSSSPELLRVLFWRTSERNRGVRPKLRILFSDRFDKQRIETINNIVQGHYDNFYEFRSIFQNLRLICVEQNLVMAIYGELLDDEEKSKWEALNKALLPYMSEVERVLAETLLFVMHVQTNAQEPALLDDKLKQFEHRKNKHAVDLSIAQKLNTKHSRLMNQFIRKKINLEMS